MKDTYLAKDFRATAARHFPAQVAALNAAFDAHPARTRRRRSGRWCRTHNYPPRRPRS